MTNGRRQPGPKSFAGDSMRCALLLSLGVAAVSAACCTRTPADAGVSTGDARTPTTAESIVRTAGTASLKVNVEGIRSDRGAIRLALYVEDSFLEDGKWVAAAVAPAQEGAVTATLDELAPGTYALAVFHDENANGKLDTGTFGQPEEGVAFSRNATGTLGPPDFADAAVEVADSATATETAVRLEY